MFSLLSQYAHARKFTRGTSADCSAGYAFGFFASESIAAGDDVLVIGASNVLGATTSYELAARLFCHNAIGEASPWHGFIGATLGKPGQSLYETLPSMAGVPQLALAMRSWARAREADSCPSVFAAETDLTALLRAWETAGPDRLTLDLWLWAEHQVRSRAFGDESSTLLPAEGTIFNHADEPTIGRHEDSSGAMVFTSIRPMQPGDELLISYGQHSAFEWLRTYEFLPPKQLECRHAAKGPASCPADVAALLAACGPDGLGLACLHAFAMRHDHTAHFNLGVQLEREGELRAAVDEYAKAAQLSPTWDEAHFNLATAYGGLGRYEESAAAARAAIAISPRHAAAHQTLGTSLFALGRVAESTAAYRAAVAIDPSDAGASRNLGLNLLHVDPDDPEGRQLLARSNRRGANPLALFAVGVLLAGAAWVLRLLGGSTSRVTRAAVSVAVVAAAVMAFLSK